MHMLSFEVRTNGPASTKILKYDTHFEGRKVNAQVCIFLFRNIWETFILLYITTLNWYFT